MLRIEALKKFLAAQPYVMCHKYTENMEVQVNVLKGDGKSIHGSYAGRRWQGYTDGLQTWNHFRIPWNASTDPKYEDRLIRFDLSQHVEAIGMTGWDWKNKQSKWVGFDFDSIVSHKQGLTQDELQKIQRKLFSLPFVTLFTSTSGMGLHVYVFINNNTIVNTHTHQAAIARAILNKISALTGLELEAKVDTLGGNMWVWHQRAILNKSYECLKEGIELTEIPSNWKEYLTYVQHKDRVIQRTDKDDLTAARNKITLDKYHIKLLQWFEQSTAQWWWDDKRQMLVCHTYDLKCAHRELRLKGFFNTVSTGKDHGQDQNCFAFPVSSGGWIIRRHTRGVTEHASWFSDSSNWTTTYYDKLPNFKEAIRLTGGAEGEKAYTFGTLSGATKALLAMEIDCIVPPGCELRPATLCELSDGRIKISFERVEHDNIKDWSCSKNRKNWDKFFFHPKIIDEIDLPDNLLKHLTISGIEYGWFIHTNNKWIQENKTNVVSALLSIGHKRSEIDNVLGQAILHNWKLVNKPFQPEYPGNREWNKNSPQLRFVPAQGQHKYWDMIFNHIGKELEEVLITNDWSKDNGIFRGLLYLQAWCASFIQYPIEPLPYLFFYGSQNTGKSSFHEALSILFTSGYIRADQALNNSSGFNGELANAILCIVEETNLSKRSYAADRIKDWVTGRHLSIHAKSRQPYDIVNCTHWVQCANDIEYCPIFPGDTRITSIKVDILDKDIPKPILLEYLEKEAPAFLWTLINFELPKSQGRLRIPVIETQEKLEQMEFNKNALERFVDECVTKVNGHVLLFSEFHSKFQQWLEPIERVEWTKRRVSKYLNFPKGKAGGNGQLHIGNISFEEKESGKKLKVINGRLI